MQDEAERTFVKEKMKPSMYKFVGILWWMITSHNMYQPWQSRCMGKVNLMWDFKKAGRDLIMELIKRITSH